MVKVFFPSESFHVKINYEARCARTVEEAKLDIVHPTQLVQQQIKIHL